MHSEQVCIILLGYIVSKGIISTDSSIIQAVKVWPVSISAHFIIFRVGQSTELLIDNYMIEIVQLHGISFIIASDRDTGFKWKFC